MMTQPTHEMRTTKHGSVSVTIEQTNEARIAELVVLQRIGRQINSTLDMDWILNFLIDEVVSATPATHGSVLLADDNKILKPRAWYGYNSDQIELLKNVGRLPRRGIVNRVFLTGEPATVDDVRQDSDYVQVVPSIRSELAVPILYGQEIVGVLDLESPLENAFGLDSRRFVLAIAEHAAIAIGNAQRYAEQVKRENAARRRNAQLRDLISISRVLHTGHVLGDVLDQVVQAIPATGGFDIAMLSLVEGSPPVLQRVAAAGIPLQDFESIRHIRQPLSTFERVLQERYRISQSYFLPHQKQDEWNLELQTHVVLADRGDWKRGDWHPQDMLIVPLRDSKGQILGILSVDAPQDHKVPTLESIEMLELFANEAASAIENARFYDQLEFRVQERTEQLADALERQSAEIDKTRAIVESISDAVLVFDAQGEIILANSATMRVLGISSEVLLHCVLDQVDPEGLTHRDAEILNALTSSARSACESLVGGECLVTMAFHAAGRVIQASFSPVTLHEGESLTIVAVFRDITREVELDRMKSEFISMAAHELRTPMTAITGYVDLLRTGTVGPVNEKQEQLLQVIKANAARLMTLVGDLLDLSKIESEGLTLNWQSVSISGVVAEVVMSLRNQIQAKSQELAVNVSSNLPEVMGDRDRILQVLMNLLSNAHKYAPRGAKLAVNGERVDGCLHLEVQDTGIGISPQDQERLFTRFFRADNAIATQEGGTGLGLAICREIIERHRGEIQVESELGQGSTFRIVLPLDGEVENDSEAQSIR